MMDYVFLQGDLPLTPGLDIAGTVEAIGDKVKSLTVGQRVIAFPSKASYSEYAVAWDVLTYGVAENINFSIVAACPTVSILSYKLLRDVARLEQGENVLIHAAAGGATAIQLAKILGAGQVIGTVSHKDKFLVIEEAGADHVLLYDRFSDKVNELTNGKGATLSWIL
ncbi:quinone oxidoreductase family protein [Halobacillus amylolyticus]|uniref:Zinc-binding dehydrogenase n=1 Tax=Halobacillus amylolyticus TaxID=2932259 RepID=A0ABY4HH74_9BACI|nr:zinc-binding dehydrogenase [Halobacillus amylolyticus]